jgi:hypothetical protein
MTAKIAEAFPAQKMFVFDSLKLHAIFECRMFPKESITTRETISKEGANS